MLRRIKAAAIVGGLMLGLVFGLTGGAYAETIDCSSNSTDFFNRMNSTLNTPEVITATVINGPCRGGFQIPMSKTGSVFTASGPITITDFVLVSGNNITLNGFTIDMTSGSGSSGALMVSGPQTGLGSGSSAQFNGGSLINNASGAGAFVASNANLVMNDSNASPGTSTTISGNQTGIQVERGAAAAISSVAISNSNEDGVAVKQHGSIQLGSQNHDTPVAGLAVTIANSGGHGLNIEDASQVEMDGGSITGNTQSGVFLALGSSANFSGVTITGKTGALAIQAIGASSMLLKGPTISGPSGGILVANASSLITLGATISTTSTTVPALEVTAASSAVLAGGNAISNSTTGPALQIDHSSSLAHEPGTQFGAPVAAEAITGAGSVQVQSSMDIGQGLISAAPSITWTLSGSEIVNVQQNSSFRLSGGVTISGGNGVKIQQGSNAFFNVNNGGTNVATIVCTNSANNPMAHIANPGSVSSVTTFNLNDVLTGDSAATHPGQTNACLNF